MAVWSRIQMNPSASYIRPVMYWLLSSVWGFRSPLSEATTRASVRGPFTIFQLAVGAEFSESEAPALRYVLALGVRMLFPASWFATKFEIPPSDPDIMSTATEPT